MTDENMNRWKAVGASIAGTRHVARGEACQDFHAWHDVGWAQLIAVADGAGSAAFGGMGAEIAVRAACECLDRNAQREEAPVALARTCFDAARVAIEAAVTPERPLASLACTFVIAVLTENQLAVVHVGDGAAVARHEDGSILCLSPPAQSEYANETTFLSSPNLESNIRTFESDKSFDAIAIFSDGLQSVALQFPNAEPHAAFFQPLWRFLDRQTDMSDAATSLIQFLQQPRLLDRTDDDLTIVLALRTKQEAATVSVAVEPDLAAVESAAGHAATMEGCI